MRSLFDSQYRAAFGPDLPDYLHYPLAQLTEAHRRQPMYHKLDTHLSFPGRLEATRIILRALDVDAIPECHVLQKNHAFGGDLARMLGSAETSVEKIISPAFGRVRYHDNRAALTGNTNNIIICHNDASVLDKTLLIVGDSFIALCLKLLSVFFRDIIYLRSANFQADAVDLFHPDIVLTSNAERYLSAVLPDDQSESILFSNYGAEAYRPDPGFAEALRAQAARRHHPRVYDRWRAGQSDAPVLQAGDLGAGFILDMISRAEGGDMRFLSLGGDPQIIFHNARLAPDRDHEIRLTLRSSVDSHCVLFLSDRTGLAYPFRRDRSHAARVRVGTNALSFTVPAGAYGPLVRLDPLTCEGRFDIDEMSVRPLPPG